LVNPGSWALGMHHVSLLWWESATANRIVTS
jgi:hypothetical protein